MIKLTPTQQARAIRKTHPSFRTERFLELTAREYCALYAVRTGLLTGQFVHVRKPYRTIKTAASFSMEIGLRIQESDDQDNPGRKIVGDILGWMSVLMNPKMSAEELEDHEWEDSPLDALMRPDGGPHGSFWERYTPKQAAKAIDAFMSGNVDDPWRGI